MQTRQDQKARTLSHSILALFRHWINTSAYVCVSAPECVSGMVFPWKVLGSLCCTRAILQSATHKQITCNLGQSWLCSAAHSSSSSLHLTAALPEWKLGSVKWAPKTWLFLVSVDKWTQVASTLSAEFNLLQRAQAEGCKCISFNWSQDPNHALSIVQHTTAKVVISSRLWRNFQENVKCFSTNYCFKVK